MDDLPAIPEGTSFEPGLLSQLKFTTGAQAVAYLRALARQNGFDLPSRDSFTSDAIRLYCHRGDRGHGEKTTKTGCEFGLKLRRHEEGYVIMPDSRLEHNHPLLPAKAPALPQDVEEHAKLMAKIGVARPAVVRFIHEATGTFPTATQVASLFSPERPHPDQSQTDALIAHVEGNGGLCIQWETIEFDEPVRGAVLTVTPDKLRNLRQFGDVLFLDGTAIRNELGWTTYPVTLLDNGNQIVSGGLLFTAFERTEVFCWLLGHFVTFLGDKLQTIFTDEDFAMRAAFELTHQENPRIYHRLCIWHKRGNFLKHVQALTRDPKVVTAAMDLFDTIAYNKSIEIVDQAVDQLIALLPKLADYVHNEIWALRAQLTEAYRGNALTLGRRSNQAGESNNNMLRHTLSAGGHTLVEIRDGYSQCHCIKEAAEVEAIARQFNKPHFLEAVFDIKLHRPLCRRVDLLVNKSKAWVCSATDEPGLYLARFEGKDRVIVWQMRAEGEDAICQCNETSGTELPCCHLIALFYQLAGRAFPARLIAPRWIPDFAQITVPPLPALTIAQADKVQRILSQVSSDDEGDTPPPPPESLNDADPGELPDESDPIVAAADTQTRRYTRLMMVAKEVVQRASVNPERYDGY
jgi:hypothetical protein